MTGTEENISVVIPAYGACPHLPKLVDAVGAQSPGPSDIIVVHSGPHDPTEALRRTNSRVRVIHRDDRLWAGAARNLGLAQVKAEWVAFIDSDVVPASNWLASLIAAAGASPDRFVVGSVGYAAAGGYWGLCLWAAEFTSVHPYLPEGECQGGASANLLVSTDVLHRVGGFPDGFAASEDAVLIARLREIGLTNWFCPSARVDHFNKRGLRHFLGHLLWLGRWGAVSRRVRPLRGAWAVKFWPFAAGLWLAKLCITYYRVLRWGRGFRLKLLALAPGVLLGELVWNLGFFLGLWQGLKPLCAANQKPE